MWRAALLGVLAVAGCQDLQQFRGDWSGPRVGGPEVRVGFDDAVHAALTIEDVDPHGLAATWTTDDGRFSASAIAPIPPAEADVLATATVAGSPLRIYLAFARAEDGGGDALAWVGLYADDRVQVRVLRGGDSPLYGIFDLRTEP